MSVRTLHTRNRDDAQAILRISGALKISTLEELGFRRGHVLRWLNQGFLYLPYGSQEPEVVMVRR